eukprot:gnl/Spiro4/9599_TR5093_c0_g1_i1.p1 gnl/Spiro4/9599_TR5093_c0_g1~~gnl/Spiro4/9599_TR5093_c0_g1_i1.p1  ORF type:complete len:649 (+),score=250.92 gnl/Spiro4/9599_TR5093_c0_g1_i1:51-1949(+)
MEADHNDLQCQMMRCVALNADLAKAVSTIHDLRSQIDEFQINFETLRGTNLNLQEQVDSYKSQLVELNELKGAQERILTEKFNALNIKFQSKCQELESAQAQIIPAREMELVRLQLQEELEKPHAEKLAFYEKETEQYREQYFDLRRKYEALNQALIQTKLEGVNDMEDVRTRAERENSILVDKLRVLQTMLDEGADAERVRILERERAENALRFAQMQKELEELREAKERSDLIKNKSAVSYQMEIGDSSSRCKALQAANEQQGRRIRHLEKELDGASKTHDRLHERILQLEKELNSMRTQLEEATHAVTAERTTASRRMIERENEWHAERSMFQKDIESLQTRLTEMQEETHEAMTRIATQEKDTALRVKKARDEEKDKVIKLEMRAQHLEKELEGLRKVEEEKGLAKMQEITTLQKEILQVRTEKRGVAMECKTAHEKVERLTQELQQALGESDSKSKNIQDLQADLRRVNEKMAKLMDKENQARQQIQTVEVQLEFVQRDLQAQNEELAHEREAHNQALQNVKKQVAKERAMHALGVQQLQNDVAEQSRQNSSLKAKAAKVQADLKDRLKRYRAKLQLAMSRLAKSELERQTIQQAMSHENKQNQILMREMERNREELLLLGRGASGR